MLTLWKFIEPAIFALCTLLYVCSIAIDLKHQIRSLGPKYQETWLYLEHRAFENVVFVQLLSCVPLFVTLWTVAHQALLSSTISQSLLKFMSIKLVMLSNHLILCHPLLLLPSIFPSIRIFSIESALPFWWQKYWSFSFSISPSNKYSELITFRIWSPFNPGDSKEFSSTTVQKHQFFSAQPSLWSNYHISTWLLEKP